MNSVKIIGNAIYLPENKVENDFFNNKFNLEENWIYKRTGIKSRYWAKDESASYMAIEATKKLLEDKKFDAQKIDCIVVASTTNEKMMPGISFEIQKALNIKKCFCIDISSGCSGYINGLDIVRLYIASGKIQYGLVVGVEVLSKYLDINDINTSILLGDGAGATLLGKCEESKIYCSNIESIGQEGDILTCSTNENIYMEGKKIYKFGTIKVSENIKELMKENNINNEEIKYIIPHQSNIRIMKSIANRLGIEKQKIYVNIEEKGNTFNASIPIALYQMEEENLLHNGDKVIIVGYGGGLNLGSVLLEI